MQPKPVLLFFLLAFAQYGMAQEEDLLKGVDEDKPKKRIRVQCVQIFQGYYVAKHGNAPARST